MTDDLIASLGSCDVCGRSEDIVGVGAVPGAAISIVWCRNCLVNDAQPLFAIEVLFMHGPQEDGSDHLADKDLTTMLAYAKHRYPDVHPSMMVADWYLNQTTWWEGEYVRIGDLVEQIWEEA
jgi:hypothetical protein